MKIGIQQFLVGIIVRGISFLFHLKKATIQGGIVDNSTIQRYLMIVLLFGNIYNGITDTEHLLVSTLA